MNMPRKKKEKLDEKEETDQERWERHKREKEDDIIQFIASLIANLLLNQTEEEYERMMIKIKAREVADKLKEAPPKSAVKSDEIESSD
jgi:hypothetical protein